MKTKTTKLTYEAPETSVDLIVFEQCIMSITQTKQMSDMDVNTMYGEDDEYDF